MIKPIRLLKAVIKKFLDNDDNVLHYLTGTVSLPKPLTKEEEEKAIKDFASGDKKSKDILVERNLRLVVYIARKFDNTGIDLDDLISVGTIGLVKAVNSYDPSKNIKLATYGSRCIENEILMHLRRAMRYRNEVSLDEPINVDYEGNQLVMSDILGTDPDIVSKYLEDKVEKQTLWTAIEKLNSREKEIMQMRFGLQGVEEKTQKEVADFLGISQSYISRLEKKILFKLKKEMVKAR